VKPELYIGMISGTSRDGLDAALVDFESGRPEVLHATCVPYPPALRQAIDLLVTARARPEIGSTDVLDRQLGHFYARACTDLLAAAGLEPRDVRAIGSHGQTVWHEPDGPEPISLQLGHGYVIANVTGIPVVSTFRNADLAAGGQGAPLAPLLHRQLFHCDQERRAVINLGGIANVTLLERDGAVRGHDTGPANCFMDLWIRRQQGLDYDDNGAWAASGTLNAELLQRLLDEPYFTAPAPKSTGLEKFNAAWLDARLQGLELPAEDVQRTLAELTLVTVDAALQAAPPDRILVCGGGVHNGLLMSRLRSRNEAPVESTADHGLHPDWVEASLFAWLARERLQRHAQDTGPITGARRPVMLGEVHHP
jgi:anhydro-N-acetylmuramic acid kinase